MRKISGSAGGVLGGFGVMAIFHVWAFAPYVKPEGQFRIGIFFIANGVGSILDYWIWGKQNTLLRMVMNWAYEIYWAQYAAARCDIPDGLTAIDFKTICRTSI
jgi:hypothetical protein